MQTQKCSSAANKYYAPIALRSAFLLLLAGLLTLSTSSAQPPKDAAPKPRMEEEEEPGKKEAPAKKSDAAKNPSKAETATNSQAKSDVLTALAEDARKRKLPLELQNYYNRLAIPFDVLTTGANVDYDIVPLPFRELQGEKIVFTKIVLGKPEKDYELPAANVSGIKPFEEIAIGYTDSFLAKSNTMTRIATVESAIKALSGVEEWHRFAVANGLRTGDGWRAVQEKLQAKIIAVRRELLAAFKEAKKWADSDKLALELITGYSNDAGVMFDVYKYRLERGRDTLREDNDQDYRDLRDNWAAFTYLPSAENDPVGKQVKAILKARARTLAKKANEKNAQGDAAGALQLLRDAEAYDADSREVKDARITLKPRILYVGVPSLPTRMSPFAARTDSERWAMELIFESLLQTIPDDALGRVFRPQLATDLPTGVGEYRSFTLSKSARWPLGEGKEPITTADVSGTLKQYRNRAYGFGMEEMSLLGDDEIEDSSHIKLKLQQRMLEPLPCFNFKVLPSRLVPDLDSDRFAKNPIGSGPYRFKGIENETATRSCAVFTINPSYASRTDHFGLPVIREIRMFVPKPEDAAKDFEAGQLHLWLDPGAEPYIRTLNEQGIANYVRGSALDANRRIWMLAINHRKPPLQKDDLRRAINHAIDREMILKDTQRPAGTKFHQVLNGPFPTNTWACPQQAKPLFQPELAKGLFTEALKEPQSFALPLTLTIRFSNADPGAAQACSQIKEHLEREAGTQLQIRIEGLSREEFQDRVLNRHEFELAYVPFDYRDDMFWLGGLLDGNAAGANQRNFLGYLGIDSGAKTDDSRLSGLLSQIRGNTDFAKLKEQMKELHDMVNMRVPFVPLWQLDRFAIAHSSLDIRFDSAGPQRAASSLDPATIFNCVEYWRLK